jgi:hypothetical protein
MSIEVLKNLADYEYTILGSMRAGSYLRYGHHALTWRHLGINHELIMGLTKIQWILTTSQNQEVHDFELRCSGREVFSRIQRYVWKRRKQEAEEHNQIARMRLRR